EYGYQPASTTARVAPTAPPSAFASSSASVKLSGDPSPRPPATITSASSIDGPLDPSAASWDTSCTAVEYGLYAGDISAIPGSPPPTDVASNEPARKSASRGVPLQPTSA